MLLRACIMLSIVLGCATHNYRCASSLLHLSITPYKMKLISFVAIFRISLKNTDNDNSGIG